MEYKKFSQEQLNRAKNADIISFLTAYIGFELRQRGISPDVISDFILYIFEAPIDLMSHCTMTDQA